MSRRILPALCSHARQLQLAGTEPGCFVTRARRVFFMARNFYASLLYGYRVAATLNSEQEMFTWKETLQTFEDQSRRITSTLLTFKRFDS